MESDRGKERTILGIDPGTQCFGWGVISVVNGKPHYIAMGSSSLKGSLPHFERLGKIFREVTHLIERYNPSELAVEAPFYGKNVQSMLKLGRAQGAAITAALNYDLPIYEYAPRKIKQSITGNGAASKEQVATILYKLLKIEQVADSYDATDGVAAALCHYLNSSLTTLLGAKGRAGGSSSSWESFLRENPERVK